MVQWENSGRDEKVNNSIWEGVWVWDSHRTVLEYCFFFLLDV